ncbi:LacI family DNA-binding transcriptional regulator [Telmatobacter sp. DSM 110680]|uniref:LacI family DNA-binding transcriptional regulator n=1 Tax=Telmatobacter sp. DSM 110680 TaxID=3036704 RepID=A0AAU7DP09_9BACT
MVQRKSGHVTLLDIAQACGYSVSTVSIVLSEAPLSQNVAASTRDRIRKMATQLGYHPDAYARSLRRRRSQTIAVLAYDLSDPFCIPIVHGIQAGLQPGDYLPLLVDAQTQRKLFDSYLRMILERRAEGVIVIASWIFQETNLLEDVEKNQVPIVIVGRDLTPKKISSLLVDNEAGGALAMRHLIDLGHRQIAIVRGPEELFDTEPRWAGVQRTAVDAGIHLDRRLVFQLPNLTDSISGFEGGLRFSKEMIASGRAFTAVLAFDDLTALGVIRGLSDAGLNVPGDCSVVGFDDVLPAAVSTPGVTTIRQPLHEMGLMASEWTLEALKSREQNRKPVKLYKAPPELVVRTSTAPRMPASRRSGPPKSRLTI